jgi:hypothetical protein
VTRQERRPRARDVDEEREAHALAG